MFEKKQLDRFSRRDRDIVLDVLKKGISQLTRLRHPKILSILHPLEDSRYFSCLVIVINNSSVRLAIKRLPFSIPDISLSCKVCRQVVHYVCLCQ